MMKRGHDVESAPSICRRRRAMEHYAGIDVSLEFSSVCVVDAQGKIVREVNCPLRAGPITASKQLPSRGGHGHASQRQRRVSHVTVEYHLSPAVLCERVADHSASGLVWVAAAAFVDPSTASISDMVGSKTFVYPDQHARLLRPWRIGLAVPCD